MSQHDAIGACIAKSNGKLYEPDSKDNIITDEWPTVKDEIVFETLLVAGPYWIGIFYDPLALRYVC